MEKPFYKSKKFVYALGTFLAALVVALLPLVVDMQPETVDMLETMLPLVIVMGLLVITGHTVTDVAAVWTEGVKAKNVREAAGDLIEAIPLPERDPQPEVDKKEVA